MPDFVVEFTLPSNGFIYNKDVVYKNQLRAPRLRDRGFGDTSRKLKLQASILDKTIVQPLNMSAYDLHTADFVYLNWLSRRLSKGEAAYKVSLQCPKCKVQHEISVDMSSIEVKKLNEPLDLKYTTIEGHELSLTYVTPRILDDCIENAIDFKNQYKDTELSLDALKTQELLRLLIKTVDTKVLTYPQQTDFIMNLLDKDIELIMMVVNSFDFGLQLEKEFTCPECGKKIRYSIPT